MVLNFNWDRDKADANAAKHGVTFQEAISVFRDRQSVIFDDEQHSEQEYREFIVGYSERHRLLIVSFTERGETIRIIGARKATTREQRDYARNRPESR